MVLNQGIVIDARGRVVASTKDRGGGDAETHSADANGTNGTEIWPSLLRLP